MATETGQEKYNLAILYFREGKNGLSELLQGEADHIPFTVNNYVILRYRHLHHVVD